MEKYAPKMKELAPRDLVARAIETEIREGRGVMNPDYGVEHVWIDLRHLPDHIHDVQIPEVSSFFKKFLNIDPKKELCPIRPSNHYHMGGIPTDENGAVERGPGEIVEGLFAIGECASASFHGFNRLGTNSILELITMGKFAGEKALEYIDDPVSLPKDAGEITFSHFSKFLNAQGKEKIGRIRSELQAMMTEKVGVFRSEQGLIQAMEAIKELQERSERAALSQRSLKMNQELVQRWELDNLLAVSMVIVCSGLHRRESRGGHFREDYPERNDDFHYHTLAYMPISGDVKLGRRPIDMSIFEARGPDYEKFGLIERKY
jgi:succinate dehydrogenase / fumarate reductase flavoprotein subunit